MTLIISGKILTSQSKISPPLQDKMGRSIALHAGKLSASFLNSARVCWWNWYEIMKTREMCRRPRLKQGHISVVNGNRIDILIKLLHYFFWIESCCYQTGSCRHVGHESGSIAKRHYFPDPERSFTCLLPDHLLFLSLHSLSEIDNNPWKEGFKRHQHLPG